MVKNCVLCYNPLTSQEHKQKCREILMFSDITIPVNNLNKLMTCGLGGCYASIILFEKNYEKFIFMIHTPFIEKFINTIQNYINEYKILHITIKCPGKYIKNDGMFIMVPDNEKINTEIVSLFNENYKYIIEPYGLDDNSYNSQIGIKMLDNKLLVSDNYGRFIKID